MNWLSVSRQAEVVALWAEGLPIRAIARLTRVHRDTIMRLGQRVGSACDRLHDVTMRNLQVARLQIDEMWGFIQKKQRHVRPHHPPEHGDCYVWLAEDERSKAVIAYHVAKRTAEGAQVLLDDLHGRLRNRPQITTDGYAPYGDAVKEAFGDAVDYTTINKQAGFLKHVQQGNPDLEKANTSLVERCHLTTRMQARRHARRTNAHSKTLENHRAATALHFAFYHWCRRHETLGSTPAMELGLTNHVWSVEELIERAQEVPAPPPLPPPPEPYGQPKLRLIRGGKR